MRYLVICACLFLAGCAGQGKMVIEKTDTPLTLSEKALDYFNNKEYSMAIAYYQAIIDNYKKDQYEKEIAWANYEIGFCYFTMGDNERALKSFNIVLAESSIQAPRVLAEKLKLKITAQLSKGTK